MNLKKLLFIIGIIWLVLVAIYLITSKSVCPSACLPDTSGNIPKCGCSISLILIQFISYGIPSWILFLIAVLTKNKKWKSKKEQT